MDYKTHLEILEQGLGAWNMWRDENDQIKPFLHGVNLNQRNLCEADLSGADLSRAHLFGANLHGAKLYGANLSKAYLIEAYLNKADLRRADLSGAYLSEADLREANLRGANLRSAYLTGTNLSEADLRGADLSRASLCGANFNGANLNYTNFTNANLNRVSFVETKLEGSDLSDSSIYGISAWNLKTDKKTKQLNLKISKDDEPIITVDDIEVAQFIYLLIKNEKLRKVINSVAEKGVLILGRFGGGGIEVLHRVAEKLREMKYLPIIFDFDRPQDKNYTETIKTLAGLSRFIVVDLSGPSVPQELYATVPHFKIPFVPILEKGKQQYAMFADILEYDWVMKPVEFDTTQALINSIPSKVVKPAEKQLEKRPRLLLELFGK